MALTISRRAVLMAAAGTALAACSSSVPTTGAVTSGSFRSTYRQGRATGWTIVRPPGHAGARLPVLVVLHGRGGDHLSPYRQLHLDAVLADVVARGGAPFALASVDGGNHDYWHPRRAGDPAGMVIHEFLPLLADRGLDVRHIGLLGWSMGGYGALYLASVLRSPRVAVAVAESPAIWRHSYQTAAGAFDDAADFEAHTVFGRERDWRGIALRIDCGDADGFAPITRTLRSLVSPTPAGGIEPGGHDPTYWRSQAPAQLTFAGRHLA